MKTKTWRLILAAALLAGPTGATSAWAQAAESYTATAPTAYTEEQKVSHLIQFVSKMKGATFIRNGSEHTCREAAEHLESKWEKHKDDVKTAEGFIEELASSSGLTGEPYRIRFADGTTKTTNEVLTQELRRLQER